MRLDWREARDGCGAIVGYHAGDRPAHRGPPRDGPVGDLSCYALPRDETWWWQITLYIGDARMQMSDGRDWHGERRYATAAEAMSEVDRVVGILAATVRSAYPAEPAPAVEMGACACAASNRAADITTDTLQSLASVTDYPPRIVGKAATARAVFRSGGLQVVVDCTTSRAEIDADGCEPFNPDRAIALLLALRGAVGLTWNPIYVEAGGALYRISPCGWHIGPPRRAVVCTRYTPDPAGR